MSVDDEVMSSDETNHGYECVELFGDCCEVGLDCYEGCEYSYTDDELERIAESNRIVEQRYGE